MPRGVAKLRTADNRMNVAGRGLRKLRNSQGLTQDALCARIALVTEGQWNPDFRDIVRIERGTRKVSDVELLVLADALNITAQTLLEQKSD